jgi:hypothetical protein
LEPLSHIPFQRFFSAKSGLASIRRGGSCGPQRWVGEGVGASQPYPLAVQGLHIIFSAKSGLASMRRGGFCGAQIWAGRGEGAPHLCSPCGFPPQRRAERAMGNLCALHNRPYPSAHPSWYPTHPMVTPGSVRRNSSGIQAPTLVCLAGRFPQTIHSLQLSTGSSMVMTHSHRWKTDKHKTLKPTRVRSPLTEGVGAAEGDDGMSYHTYGIYMETVPL